MQLVHAIVPEGYEMVEEGDTLQCSVGGGLTAFSSRRASGCISVEVLMKMSLSFLSWGLVVKYLLKFSPILL